jgi:hypothetical protein
MRQFVETFASFFEKWCGICITFPKAACNRKGRFYNAEKMRAVVNQPVLPVKPLVLA